MKLAVSALLLASVCLLSGCSIPGSFYLLDGPLASENPQQFSASLKAEGHPESLSAVLAQGEGFEGRWLSDSAGKTRMQDQPVAPQPKLGAAWDAVYGQGFFTARIVGNPFFSRTVLTGSKGTVLQVEIYRRVRHDDPYQRNLEQLDIQGVAQDDKGNIYKIVF